MTDKLKAINALRTSTQKLIDTLAAFPPTLFNTKPVGGGWSVAQVADHLLQLEKRINHIIAAPATTTDRKADEKVELISKALLDSTRKYQSPSFIVPSDALQDQQHIISALQLQKNKLLSKIDEVVLEELCIDFPHNRLGEFTRLEWVYFTICHTERHLQQIEGVRSELN